MPEDWQQIYSESILLNRYTRIQDKIKSMPNLCESTSDDDALMSNLTSTLRDYQKLSPNDNFESTITSLRLPVELKSLLFSLHNSASSDQNYGERLYHLLNLLKQRQLITSN